MKSKMQFLGAGRHRGVFLLPSCKYVLKVPLNEFGYSDNLLEYHRFKNGWWLEKEKLAKCKLLSSGLLIMEYVQPIKNPMPYFNELENSWIGYIDLWQVGFNKDNKLVAFDYAQRN